MERGRFDISGYSEEERLALAQELLASPIVDNHRNLDIIETTPLAYDYPFGESLRRMLLVNQANEFLPEIKPIVLEITAIALHLPDTEPKDLDTLIDNLRNSPDSKQTTTNALHVVEALLRNPDTFGFSSEHFRLATAHIGTEFAARLFKSEADTETRKVWLAYIHYFAAVECLFSGVQTNDTLFAVYPEKAGLELIEELLTLVSVADEKEAKEAHTRSLFEGNPVSPIKDLGDGKLYFSVGRPTE